MFWMKKKSDCKIENESQKDMIRKHIIFHGRVQGVGFRFYSVYNAKQLHLTGWVRNLLDGSVEMEVQGTEEKIDELILILNNQAHIVIERMEVKTIPVIKERSFAEIY